MQTYIIWLFAVYGLSVMLIQLQKWFYQTKKQPAIHYVVYTYYSQAKIEWVIRSLSQLAKLEGREFYFYVIDSGSNDDTLKIIDRLEKSGIQIKRNHQLPEDISYQDKNVNVIDLREDCYSCELRTT